MIVDSNGKSSRLFLVGRVIDPLDPMNKGGGIRLGYRCRPLAKYRSLRELRGGFYVARKDVARQ